MLLSPPCRLLASFLPSSPVGRSSIASVAAITVWRDASRSHLWKRRRAVGRRSTSTSSTGATSSRTSVSDDERSAKRERSRTVSSYYNQVAIDEAAAKKSIHLTPSTIMYTGAGTAGTDFIVKSAKYLRKELPIRLAHRIAEIRTLPFIVGCNPTILAVHELYIKAFQTLNDFPKIETLEDEERFAQVLRDFLDDHKDVISMLAQGFKECRKHIKDEELITRYLDKNMSSRLAVRMLCTHQILLRENKPGQIGIIKLKVNLKDLIEQKKKIVDDLALDRYGHAPLIKVNGHTSVSFPYIEMPLDYILPELLKNAMRATVEHHEGARGEDLPPIKVTIASNPIDFIIRISDRGGGIPHDKVNDVMKYNFSTAEESTEKLMDQDIFGGMMEAVNRSTAGPMHGFGFGLPVSRAYASYLGGSLIINSIQGYGTDVHLRLRHFDPKSEEFRI